MDRPRIAVPSAKLPESKQAPARRKAEEAEVASQYCPACSARLQSRSCKLICPACGYYMSCSDFY
jgi:hypothetical protein